MSGAREAGFVARGVAAGAAAMIAAVILVVGFVAVLAGGGGAGWGDHKALAGIMFTALWCLAATVAAAVGAWQAAEGGAPDPAAARFAGALGPVALIFLVSVVALAGDAPTSPLVIGVEGSVEIAAAVIGAGALARRLESTE